MQYQDGVLTIMVQDLDRAVRFYTETLGLEPGFRAGDHWAEVRGPGLKLGLHPARPGQPVPVPGASPSIGLLVADLDATMAELQGRGLTFAGPVQDGGIDRIVHFADPDGTPLYLFQYTAQPPRG